MSARTATLAGRRAARKRFIDECKVERRDPNQPPPVMDPTTHKYPDPPMMVVYQGPFAIQVRSDINANAVEAVTGEGERMYRTATMQFPVDTPADAVGSTAAIRDDDQLTIIRCALDIAMEGRTVNLQADTKGKSFATMRRFRSREPLA